jgi:hypothetical protein
VNPVEIMVVELSKRFIPSITLGDNTEDQPRTKMEGKVAHQSRNQDGQ